MAKKTKPPQRKIKPPGKSAKAAKKAPRTFGKAAAAPQKSAAGVKRSKSSWFDVASHKPLIAEQARRLKTFLAAMADGVIDKSELEAQEERLVAAMQEIEPLLEPDLHAKVTRLLCELTAYDLMQILHSFHEARPKSAFQG
jgi:hypothetical protein